MYDDKRTREGLFYDYCKIDIFHSNYETYITFRDTIFDFIDFRVLLSLSDSSTMLRNTLLLVKCISTFEVSRVVSVSTFNDITIQCAAVFYYLYLCTKISRRSLFFYCFILKENIMFCTFCECLAFWNICLPKKQLKIVFLNFVFLLYTFPVNSKMKRERKVNERRCT